MAKIISVGTCDAPHKFLQSEVKHLIHNLFSSYPDIDRMINVFDNSEIKNRHISVPIEWFKYKHTFSERSSLYREMSVKLTKAAIHSCLEKQDIPISDINCVILISSTGIITPTLDAILFNELGFSEHIKRIPIWGLGCAGGAAGISRASEYVKAYPENNCLLVAVELCSLTFLKDDLTKSNIVAASLFSDGCAAVLVSGEKSKHYNKRGLKFIDSLSTIYKESLDVMGWDIVDDGFRVLFSRDIPTIVRESVRSNIEELLTNNGLKQEDLNYYITHPGGMKVIKAYEESLGLLNGSLKYSRKVLSEHGNMSSPSVLYVMNEFFLNSEFSKGGYGLLSALGPGFSSELVLFEAL